MSEAQPGGLQPEAGADFFSIEGEGRKFFLDKGEKLTENPEGTEEFGGFINLRDADGNEQKFPGRVVDGGDHWLVERYDAVGGEYLIPKAGGAPEVKPEAGEGVVAAPVEVGPGLEDAAAVAAMETAEATPQGGLAGYQLIEGKEEDGKLLGRFRAPDGKVWDGIANLGPDGKVKIMGRQAPVPAVEEAKEPAAEPEPEPPPAPVAEAAPEPIPEPLVEPTAVSAEAGRPTIVAEARQEFDKEFKDADARARQAKYEAERRAGLDLEKQAQQLKAEAERARNSVSRLRNKDRIVSAIREESNLMAEAKKLEGQAAEINALEQDQIKAIEDRRQRALELTQEVRRWGNLMENPALMEEYRGLDGRMQEDLAAAEKLFGGGNPEDQQVLDAARKRIEGRTQARRLELQGMFPRRFMELAGMAPRQDLGDAAIDYTLDRDLIERYYQFADQFYAELTGQPQAQAQAQEVVEVTPALEPILPPEPVEQPVVEITVEEAMPVAEAIAESEVAEQAAEEAAPVEEPVEAPAEAAPAAKVVVDEEERARAEAAKPAEAGVAQTPEQVAEDLERIRMEMAPPPAEEGQPEVALTPEQIRERAERRRNNFADAVAQLEGAYLDTSGTKKERVGRVVERMRVMVLVGLELAEEGGAAQEAVMNVLGRLNNEQNRQLLRAAVGPAPEQVDQAVGNMLRARGAFGPDGKPKSRKDLEDLGLVGFIELLLQLGMSFTDASINAVITEVQSVTGAGR